MIVSGSTAKNQNPFSFFTWNLPSDNSIPQPHQQFFSTLPSFKAKSNHSSTRFQSPFDPFSRPNRPASQFLRPRSPRQGARSPTQQFTPFRQAHQRSPFFTYEESRKPAAFGNSAVACRQSPSSAKNPPYFVDLHVGTTSTVQLHNGQQTHAIQGPANVTIISNCYDAPNAFPVTVPPGQYVQQVVDDNGVLRSVYISSQPSLESSRNFQEPPRILVQLPSNAPPPTTRFIFGGDGLPMKPPSEMQNGFPPVPPSAYVPDYRSTGGAHPDERAFVTRQKLKKKLADRKQTPQQFPHQHFHAQRFAGFVPQPYTFVTTGPIPTPSMDGNMPAEVHDDSTDGSSQQTDSIKTENDIIAEILSSLDPVTVDVIDAYSATVACKRLDEHCLLYTIDGINSTIDDNQLEYFICCGETVEKQKTFALGNPSEPKLQLVELKPNTEYRVSAYIRYGDIQGRPSEAISFRTKCSVPDAPESPRLQSRTKNSLTIKWVAPRSDNGSKIIRYIVEHDQEQANDEGWTECYRGPDKSCKIVRLQNSTTYRIRITAENEVGLGPSSQLAAFSTSGLAPPPPDPPRILEVSAHHIGVEWDKRATDDYFTLQIEDPSTGHGFLNAYVGQNTNYVCHELNRVTEYKLRLSAENTDGTSPYSQVVSVKTFCDPPGPLSKPHVRGKVAPTSFRIFWDPPKDNGGEPVIEYFSECTGTDNFRFQSLGPETCVAVSGVEPGQHYFFRVHARNSAGAGDYSDVCMIHTPAVAPGECAEPRTVGQPKATSALLTWDPPAFNGGEQILSYELRRTSSSPAEETRDDEAETVSVGNQNRKLVDGLFPGRVYYFSVRAQNSAGAGPWSSYSEVRTDAGPPDAPEHLRLQAQSSGSILAAWKEPASNGAPVMSYRLEMAEKIDEHNFIPIYTGPKLNFEVKGLKPNSEYVFRISAQNSAGHGPFSQVQSCWTSPSVPCPVQAEKVSYMASATAITLTWQPPVDNGSAITAYKVDIGDVMHHIGSNVPQCLLDGLLPDTLYRIGIQACNSIGEGPYSQGIKVKTKPVPPEVPSMESAVSSQSGIKVKWTSVAKNGAEVEYALEMAFNKKDSFQTVYNGRETSYKLAKVRDDTDYFFRVRALNEAGSSAPSEIIDCHTPKAAPPALKAPKVLRAEEGAVVHWLKVPQNDEDDIIYVLQLARNEEAFTEIYKGKETTFKLESLESGVLCKFRVKAVRNSVDARNPHHSTVQGPWSPLATFVPRSLSSSIHPPVRSQSDHSAESSASAAVSGKRRALSSRSKMDWQSVFGKLDLSDERVAIIVAGLVVLLCVVLVSSYVLVVS